MNATAYAATNITRFPAPRRLQQAAVAPRVTATTTPRVSASDVRDLIEAAGPLSMRDIAGGLGVTEREAASVIRWMADAGELKQDEWGRLRLWGAYRA